MRTHDRADTPAAPIADPASRRWHDPVMPRPRRTNSDLIKAANEIRAKQQNIGFMAGLFVQVCLPYRDPGDVPVWTRRNGNLTLRVQPGWTFDEHGRDVPIGYPSGVMPRLLINWMSTEAVRTKSPDLELGDSMRSFMAKLNLKPTGGKNGSISRLRTQMERLFRARLSLHQDTADSQLGADLSIASFWNLQWPSRSTKDHPDQQSLLPSVVRLSPDFFQAVVDSPVPVDMDALIALRGSAFRLDLYVWLTYRMSYLSQPTIVTWKQISEQFGYRVKWENRMSVRQFKSDVLKHLDKVLIVYNEARVEAVDAGLKLRPSPPHVPLRGLRELHRA